MAEVTVPSLPSLVRIISGDDFTCGYLTADVKYWGRERTHSQNYVSNLYLPALKNPLEITGGANHMCALDDNGVQCWGSDAHNGELEMPTGITHPKHIASGAYHICVLHDGGVVCWGATNSPFIDFGQTHVPQLSNPTRVFANGYLSCAEDDTGLVCWGGGAKVPTDKKYTSPTEVGVGGSHACGLYPQGIHCWGNNDYGQLNVPSDLAY